MLIGYMVGFETEDGWKPITFWQNNVGRWFATMNNNHVRQYPSAGATYMVFTSPVDAKIAFNDSTKVDVIRDNPLIVEVDLDPVKKENMSEARQKEYFYHKLQSSREAV
jgi:hypothetical protein